tara:strand:- start:1130 stop:1423 length:294 start_codon:yes stop_codon:yes gene_type:complete
VKLQSLDGVFTFEVYTVLHKKMTNRLFDSVSTPQDSELFFRDAGLKGFEAGITSDGSISFLLRGDSKKQNQTDIVGALSCYLSGRGQKVNQRGVSQA